MSKAIVADALAGKVKGLMGTVADAAFPNTIPNFDAAWDAFQKGFMTQDQFARLCQANGICVSSPLQMLNTMGKDLQEPLSKVWQRVLSARLPRMSEQELTDLLMRGIIDEPKWRKEMKYNTWDDPDYLKWKLDLTQDVPGASDLVLFATREVWDPALLVKFGYNDEYPADAEPWFASAGLAYPINSPKHTAAGLGDFKWSKAYWWAHWQLPSPNQALEMLHRLRPSLANPAVARDPSGELFSFQDFNDLIKTQDYPPYWRGKLAAVGYKPIGLRYVQKLYDSGLASKNEVNELWLDQSYNQRDAKILTEQTVIAKQIEYIKQLARDSAALLKEGYTIGTIDEDHFKVGWERVLLQTPAQLATFDALGFAQQLVQADANPIVLARVAALKLKIINADAKEVVSTTRRLFLSGRADANTVKQLLNNIGLDPVAVQRHIDTWKAEFTIPRKEIATGQVTKYLREGLITPADAIQRLTNLGWDQRDQTVLLAEVGREVALDQAKIAMKIAQTQKQAIQAAKQAIAAAKAAVKQAQAALSAHGTPSQMQTWYQHGILSAGEFASRLSFLGWPLADIQRLIKEADDARAKAAQAAAIKAAKPPKPQYKQVSAATLLKWMKKKIIGVPTCGLRLLALGFSFADVKRMVKEAGEDENQVQPPATTSTTSTGGAGQSGTGGGS